MSTDHGPLIFDAPGDDGIFSSIGDMLTPDELRKFDLKEPTHIAYRDDWLAEYKASGIADDQDPGAYEFELVIGPNETIEDVTDRALFAVETLHGIRGMADGS